MKKWLLACVTLFALSIPSTGAAQVPSDMLDLSTAQVYGTDFRSWTPTVAVTNVELSSREGVRLVFDRSAVNGRWPDVLNWPPAGYLQWTLGACVKVRASWHCAPLHEFWSDRHGAPRIWSGAHPLTLADDGARNNWQANWAYDGRWGAMSSYVPAAGDDIAFFAIAGAVRPGTSNHITVTERSNIVVGKLTLNGFMPASAASGPGPVTPPPVVPPVSTTPDLLPRLTALETAVALLTVRLESAEGLVNSAVQWEQVHAVVQPLRDQLLDHGARLVVLEARPLLVSCKASLNLGAARIPISCVLQ